MEQEIRRILQARTHYEVLGVDQSASEAVISKAYKKVCVDISHYLPSFVCPLPLLCVPMFMEVEFKATAK